jgi:hypothetical protein
MKNQLFQGMLCVLKKFGKAGVFQAIFQLGVHTGTPVDISET